jgi:hypothetical protein
MQTKENKKQWKINNPGKVKLYNKKSGLKRFYGITVEEYDLLFNKQEGKCLICDKHQSEFKRAFDVDHNHKTGIIRGLLCGGCNLLIGNAKEDVNILAQAINYLNNN